MPTEAARRRRAVVTWLLCVLLPLTFVFGLWYSSAIATQQRCEASNEFRGFFSSYLHAQIAGPIEDSPGFDKLSSEIQTLLRLLTPAIDAGRSRDEAYAATYDDQFPVTDCPLL